MVEVKAERHAEARLDSSVFDFSTLDFNLFFLVFNFWVLFVMLLNFCPLFFKLFGFSFFDPLLF